MGRALAPSMKDFLLLMPKCDITTRMAFATGHVMNIWTYHLPQPLYKKTCLIQNMSSLKSCSQRQPTNHCTPINTFASKTRRHHFTHWVTFHISRFKTLFVNQNLSLVYIISMHHKYGTQDILIGQR